MVVVVVLRVCGGVETIKRRIFPATSKQLTDHRPEGSVSTTQDVNGRLSEQELRCQSVHHPLSLSLSLQVSFHHGVNLRHCYVRRKRKKKPSYSKRNFDLACVLPLYNSFISKKRRLTPACGSLRGSRLHSLLPLSPSL